MPEFELDLTRIASGGAALGEGPDGRVVFATGGLPNERVVVSVTKEHKRRLEAVVTDVILPDVGRRPAPCPHVAEGCGGCDWQHATEERQSELRRAVVSDSLRRLAGINDVAVRPGPVLSAVGYRTTVRAMVSEGRAGYRVKGSHDAVRVDSCLIAHPLVEELLVDGRFDGADEVTVRVGARTGERMVIVSPNARSVSVPDDVIVVSAETLTAGNAPHIHEELGGRRFQVSAGSFLQCRPEGAEALAELAELAIIDHPGTLLDAYCGVGVFGALAGTGRAVVGVESNRAAVADAAVNFGSHGRVIRSKMERWRSEPVGAIIADPARSGLGAEPARRLAATNASVIALISCDPASLARDASLLQDHGYELDWVTGVDMFGNTSHIETVSRLVRVEG